MGGGEAGGEPSLKREREGGAEDAAAAAVERARAIAAKLGAGVKAGGRGRDGGGFSSAGGGGGGAGAIEVEIRRKVYVPTSSDGVDFLALLLRPDGSGLRKVEEATGTQVSLRGRGSSKDGRGEEDEDLHVLIVSDKKESASRAEDMVRAVLFDPAHASKIKQRQLSHIHKGPGATLDDPNIHTVKVGVRKEIVGSVIGRGGETIRDLKDRTGAGIAVTDPDDPDDPIRTIHIRGSKEAVAAAEEVVRRLIREREEADAEHARGGHGSVGAREEQRGRPGMGFGGDPPPSGPQRQRSFEGDTRTVYTIQVANEKVGLVIGVRGATIKTIQTRHNVRIDVPTEPDPGNPMVRTVMVRADAHEQFLGAQEDITRAIADGPPARGGGAAAAAAAPGAVLEIYDVPSQNIGIVIGKQGITIRGIEQSTGCSVQVQPPQPGDAMRHVHLHGFPEQVRLARQAIDACIADYHGGRGGGGGGMGMALGGAMYGAYGAAYGAPTYGAPYGAAYGAPHFGYAQQQQQQHYYMLQQQQQQQQLQQQQTAQLGAEGTKAPEQQPEQKPVGGSQNGDAQEPRQTQQVEQKYTREQWKAWRAYYAQFPGYADSMPVECPPHLLIEDEAAASKPAA